MQVVEGSQKLDPIGIEHAVSKDIARHVSDPRYRHHLLAETNPDFSKMSTHTLPRSPCGNGFLLVVVPV